MRRWVLSLLPLFWIFLLLMPGSSFAETPLTKIKGDILEYSDSVYKATGNVVITQENKRLTASDIIMDSNTGDITAHGNVEFIDGDNTLSSESLMINLRTNYGRIDEGRIFIKQDNYHIEGDTIEKLSENRFKIKKAVFTTCDGTLPCWKFRGQDVDVHLHHAIKAEGVSFSVMDVPVLYIPYITLPILKERQTGFLTPRVGYNTGEGLKINNAFFWVISDRQDATLYADYYGEKGWGSGLEYRYIFSRDTSGKFNGYYINDIQVDRARWDVKYNHRQVLSEDMSARLRVNYINDKTLYKDISEDIGERLQRTQDSDIYVNRRRDTLSMHLWGQYTQNLSGKSEGIFNRLPEAGLRVMDSRISTLPVYWNLTSSASRWEETNTGLTRLHLAPRISARLFETTGLVFVPEAGAEQTFYYIDGDNDPVRSTLYDLAASVSARFYRSFDGGGSGRIEHFIEPVIRYEYADGSSVGTPPFPDPNPPFPPLVKGGIKETSVTEKNVLSLSLINRIVSMDRDKGYEPFYLRLTQMYRVSSPAISNPPPSGFSDLRLEAIIRLPDKFSIDTDTMYAYKDNSVKSAGADLAFKGDSTHMTFGQRYSEDPAVIFLTASAGIRLTKEADTSLDLWYDNKDHVMREADYSVRYNSQCWGLTISYKYKPDEEQFNILLILKGIGSVGG